MPFWSTAVCSIPASERERAASDIKSIDERHLEKRPVAARPAARAHAAASDLADAPGGALSAGISCNAGARRRFLGDVHESGNCVRNHLAAGDKISARCCYFVLGYPHDS